MIFGPDRQREMVACGVNMAPLEPTTHLKLDPWGKLWQWYEASAPDGQGGVVHVGKWLAVKQE